MPTWLAPILASLLDAFPRIAALFARAPAPPVTTPRPPGWSAIDAEEDRAAAAGSAAGKGAP
jgi:hypothetical protein